MYFPFKKKFARIPRLLLTFKTLWNWNSILQSLPARWQLCCGCVTTSHWSFWKDQKSSSNKVYYAKYSIGIMLRINHSICTNHGERPKTCVGTSTSSKNSVLCTCTVFFLTINVKVKSCFTNIGRKRHCLQMGDANLLVLLTLNAR